MPKSRGRTRPGSSHNHYQRGFARGVDEAVDRVIEAFDDVEYVDGHSTACTDCLLRSHGFELLADLRNHAHGHHGEGHG